MNYTQGDFNRILTALGAQLDLFSFDSDSEFKSDLANGAFNSRQSRFVEEVISTLSRAKAFKSVKSTYLSFAQSVYQENYSRIHSAAPLDLPLGDSGSIDFEKSMDEPDTGGAHSIEGNPSEFSESSAFAVRSGRASLAILMGSYLEKAVREQKIGLGPKSGVVPVAFSNPDFPILKVFPLKSALFNSLFLAGTTSNPTVRKEALEKFGDISQEQSKALEDFARLVAVEFERIQTRHMQLFNFMVQVEPGSSGAIEPKGLGFYVNEMSIDSEIDYLSSEMGKLFAEQMRSLPAQGQNSKISILSQRQDLSTEAKVDFFVFDGQRRHISESKWSDDELQAYKDYLATGLRKEADKYRDRLQQMKESLIEMHGEDGIKEKGIDIGTLAIEALEQEGVFPVSDLRRKVFATVPDRVKEISKELDSINYDNKSAWDDPEDEEAQVLFKKAVQTMKWVVSNARVQLAYSGGKDSTILLYALLKGMKENQAEGIKNFPVRVLSSDTLIENPEITNNLHLDHESIDRWAKLNDLDIQCRIAMPDLLSQYQVAQVGGRKLHNMPTKGSECSQDWKVSPMAALRSQWRAEINGEPIITVTGTRLEESIHRRGVMKKREDSDEKITISDKNELIMSPICSLTSNHVFKLLDVHLVGEIAMLKQQGLDQKDWPYPTDGTRTQRIYSDSSSSSCELVNAQLGQVSKTGCGARTGCWNCQKVQNDSSAENMLKKTPEAYAYMAPLLRFRKWVSDVHNDPATRSFVGRTINTDGLMKFGHDNYHPSFLQDMLRYLLTMQIEHDKIVQMQRESNPTKEYPSLQIFNLEQLIAVQYEWSRYGRESKPFEALAIYDDIYNQGSRYYPPVLGLEETLKIRPLPAPPSHGFIKVGVPFVDYHPDNMERIPSDASFSTLDVFGQGLRNIYLEMASFEPRGVHKVHEDPITGTQTMLLDSVSEATRFEVDLIGAQDFLNYELQRALNTRENFTIAAGVAAKMMIDFGFVMPRNAKAQHSLISQFQLLESVRLTPATYSHEDCIARLVDHKGSPLTNTDEFTIDYYYNDPKTVEQRLRESKDLLERGRARDSKTSAPVAASMDKDAYKKYKRLETQQINSQVLSDVNDAIKEYLLSNATGNRESHADNAVLLNNPQNLVAQTMSKIVNICERAIDAENDLAGIDTMRRIEEMKNTITPISLILQQSSDQRLKEKSAKLA